MQLVLFDPYIGPNQVLPFRARVDLGAMTMKGYSVFSKAPASLEPIQDTRWVGKFYPSAEKQSLYSTAPVDWAIHFGVEQFKVVFRAKHAQYLPCVGSYLSAKMQSVYSTAPADWEKRKSDEYLPKALVSCRIRHMVNF